MFIAPCKAFDLLRFYWTAVTVAFRPCPGPPEASLWLARTSVSAPLVNTDFRDIKALSILFYLSFLFFFLFHVNSRLIVAPFSRVFLSLLTVVLQRFTEVKRSLLDALTIFHKQSRPRVFRSRILLRVLFSFKKNEGYTNPGQGYGDIVR